MPEKQEPRRGREGGRWLNERPTSEEFARWFNESMKLDPVLKHEDYIGGVVLIPAVDERARVVTGFTNQGAPILDQRAELSYIPYAKVETRVAYYWDLLDAHPEWVGVVENVPAPRLPIDPIQEALEVIVETEATPTVLVRGEPVGRRQEITRFRPPSGMATVAHQLQQGFSILSVPVGQGSSHFVCCTIRVSIFDREQYEKNPERAIPLRTGRGTKQVPLLIGRNNPYADPNSLMKAETGALGRALGFAGIFVIPGSGVATAEDMLEAIAQGPTPAETTPENTGPAAPADAPVRTGGERAAEELAQVRSHTAALWKRLQEQDPERAKQFASWMQQRGHRDFNVPVAALRGIARKLEKLHDEAAQAPARIPTEAPDAEPGRPAE